MSNEDSLKDENEEIDEINELLDKLESEATTKPKVQPTKIYVKLYEDGTLILSSYDYIDINKKLSKEYNSEDIPFEDKQNIKNIIILDKIIVSEDNNFIKNYFKDLNVTKLDLRNLDLLKICFVDATV